MTNRVKLGCVAHVRDSDDKGNEFNPIYRFAAGFLPCGRAVSGVRAAALRVLTEERIFLAEFDCEHVRNIPTFDWAFPERSRFTTFCHRKVAPKVSARRKRRGTAVGLRLKRYADKLAPAFSPAHPPPVLLPAFSQGGSCGALRATIKRMSPFIVCAARNHDHLVACRFGRPAIFRRDGCLSSGSS